MGTFPPWSELPQELLSAIAELLRSHSIDILSFRSVCKSWHSSSFSISSTILHHPLPLIIPSIPPSLRSRCYISHDIFSTLSVTVVYAVRPPVAAGELRSCMPKAWLVFVDQTNPNKVSIRDPFAQTTFSLPTNFPESIDLLSFRATELGRFYNLSYLTSRCVKRTKFTLYFGLVRKVVLFRNDEGYLFAVVLSDDGKLGLLRLGVGNMIRNLFGSQARWEIIHDGKGFRFDDIVEFKGRMMGIDRRGRVYKIDIGCSSQVRMNVIVPPVNGGGGRRKRLVESLGCLHIVVRCNAPEGSSNAVFKVFKLDENVRKWVEVKSLGDRTFFFGLEFSFSVSAEELHESYGKNCVLFKQHSFLSYSGNDDDSRLFLCLASSDLHIGVWDSENAAHLGVIGSHSDYSDVIWPPPSWFWQKSKTERLEALQVKLDLFRRRIPNQNFMAFEKLTSMQKESAVVLMMQIHTKQEILNQVRLMDMQQNATKIETNAVRPLLLNQHCISQNLHNQIGTSTLGTEERYLSVDSLVDEAMIQSNCGFGLFATESTINAFILQFEENMVDFENALMVNNF